MRLTLGQTFSCCWAGCQDVPSFVRHTRHPLIPVAPLPLQLWRESPQESGSLQKGLWGEGRLVTLAGRLQRQGRAVSMCCAAP